MSESPASRRARQWSCSQLVGLTLNKKRLPRDSKAHEQPFQSVTYCFSSGGKKSTPLSSSQFSFPLEARVWSIPHSLQSQDDISRRKLVQKETLSSACTPRSGVILTGAEERRFRCAAFTGCRKCPTPKHGKIGHGIRRHTPRWCKDETTA